MGLNTPVEHSGQYQEGNRDPGFLVDTYRTAVEFGDQQEANCGPNCREGTGDHVEHNALASIKTGGG